MDFSLVSLAQNDKFTSMTNGTFKKAFKILKMLGNFDFLNFESLWNLKVFGILKVLEISKKFKFFKFSSKISQILGKDFFTLSKKQHKFAIMRKNLREILSKTAKNDKNSA